MEKNLSWGFEIIDIFCNNAVLNICRYLKRFYTYKKINSIFVCISQLQLRPAPPPRADPRALAFFFLPWMANSRGWGLLSCQIRRGGDEIKK